MKVSSEQARPLLGEIYGLEATLSPLDGEYDSNFLVETRLGERFVFKLMRPGFASSLVDMQCQALRHLERQAPELVLPRVIVNSRGEDFRSIEVAGQTRIVWLLRYIPGRVLARVKPHTAELIRSLGVLLARLDSGLEDFRHPAADRDFRWSPFHADWVQPHLTSQLFSSGQLELIRPHFETYQSQVLPVLGALSQGVVYGDANDHNIIVSGRLAPQASSVIDFGDMMHAPYVSELATACAYLLLGKSDPVATVLPLVEGYHSLRPLSEEELEVLFNLVCMRLVVSVVNSADRTRRAETDPYIRVSEGPAWAALQKLAEIPRKLPSARFREVCGYEPHPNSRSVREWLSGPDVTVCSLLPDEVSTGRFEVFDLSVGSPFLGADPAAGEVAPLTEAIFSELRRKDLALGVGRYDEPRLLYKAPAFGSDPDPTMERRTIHLGLDLFVAPGTPIRAPLDGRVNTVHDNAQDQDYGPMVILEHLTSEGLQFFTLYGHMAADVLDLCVGEKVCAGAVIGSVGAPPDNGNWPPHLHFQLIVDLLGLGNDFPGVAPASQRDVWKSLSPDPNLLTRLPKERLKPPCHRIQTLERRRRLTGSSLRLSYRKPLKIVRGWMQFLYDDTGRAFLDFYNNVPHVGHSHPRVVEAVRRQLSLLNTNTRYLHDNFIDYAASLTERFPPSLNRCFFLNSASEANELALRLARTFTTRKEIVVLDHAYHGHTSSLVDLSPYKFNGPGGSGPPDWVRVAPLPDRYRGSFGYDHPEAGERYAAEVEALLDEKVAAFIAETLPSVGGQVVLPEGYLKRTFESTRQAGAVAIADEVQAGFGRIGSHFWCFEAQNALPDIVVLGKPIGNGFPIGAVVTRAEIAEAFDNGMEFFSTFGGNTVACAAGLAVLEIIDEEDLQKNALRCGELLGSGLLALQKTYPVIGDVRGLGLMMGIELVENSETKEPATAKADYLVNRLRELGVLTGTEGPYHNVVKIRPPLAVRESDIEFLIGRLSRVLGEDPMQVG